MLFMAASQKSATRGIVAYKRSIEAIINKYVRVGVCTLKKIYKNTTEYNKTKLAIEENWRTHWKRN